MRSLATFLIVSAALGVGMFVGCSSETSGGDPGSSSTTGNFTTGSMSNAACNGAFPNGACNAQGQDKETCECQDCSQSAMCTGRCNDDGNCAYNVGIEEDCSCEIGRAHV